MGNSSMSVTPSAARLTGSLRDIGYDFSSAIADLIDNSITAGASRIDVIVEFAGELSKVFIADDGIGMTPNGLIEALRFGSRRHYGMGDLGRYGLGLKTASLSQSRSLTVVTRRAQGKRLIHTRQLDLDLIAELDDWLVVEPPRTEAVGRARRMLEDSQGTVVVWEKLDRVLPEKNAAGGWARRRIETLTQKTEDHLAMVFHRYLDDATERKLTITVNGKKLSPWDPFATSEPGTKALPLQRFEIVHGEVSGWVSLQRYVLPGRDRFSSPSEFDRLSGPLKWNRQQGIYIYRANRLVQWGGWSGIRGIDEHTKLARVSIDFDTDLDEAFNINVAKMRVSIPPQLRQMLERPINEVCMLADDAYRKTAKRRGGKSAAISNGDDASVPNAAEFGLALKSAAVQAGEYAALKRITAELRSTMPHVASSLGL